MAFGFPAYHEGTQKFNLRSTVLVAAVENALRDLGWEFERIASGTEFNAKTKWNIWSYLGEKVRIEIGRDGNVWIRSECLSPIQWYDGMPFPWYGKNRQNVEKFLDLLSQSLGS
jgi:hypothetical protein